MAKQETRYSTRPNVISASLNSQQNKFCFLKQVFISDSIIQLRQ